MRPVGWPLPQRAVAVLVAIVPLVAYGSSADVTLQDLIHLDAQSAARLLGPECFGKLQAAVEDVNAVLAFKRPTHAKLDAQAPLPADGGTTFYKGDGYSLTIVKSLFSFTGADGKAVHGYMYGPALALEDDLGVGNGVSISRVSFYPADKLHELLLER